MNSQLKKRSLVSKVLELQAHGYIQDFEVRAEQPRVPRVTEDVIYEIRFADKISDNTMTEVIKYFMDNYILTEITENGRRLVVMEKDPQFNPEIDPNTGEII